jgi:hypothetical protein
VQVGAAGHLFDGYGKLLQSFFDTLGPRFYPTAIRGGQLLVREAVLMGLKGFLFDRFFRVSVWDVNS